MERRIDLRTPGNIDTAPAGQILEGRVLYKMNTAASSSAPKTVLNRHWDHLVRGEFSEHHRLMLALCWSQSGRVLKVGTRGFVEYRMTLPTAVSAPAADCAPNREGNGSVCTCEYCDRDYRFNTFGGVRPPCGGGDMMCPTPVLPIGCVVSHAVRRRELWGIVGLRAGVNHTSVCPAWLGYVCHGKCLQIGD